LFKVGVPFVVDISNNPFVVCCPEILFDFDAQFFTDAGGYHLTLFGCVFVFMNVV